MAATFVQSALGTSSDFSTSQTVETSAITTTAGNPAFVFVQSANSGSLVIDSKGNTWTAIGGNITTSDGIMGRLWYCPALVGAGSGHTFSGVGINQYPTVIACEFTGTIDTASIGSVADNSAPWTVTSGAFLDADELAVVFVGGGNSSGTEVYAASGYTKVADQPSSDYYTACVFTKQLASASAETATVTRSSGTVNTAALFIIGIQSADAGTTKTTATPADGAASVSATSSASKKTQASAAAGSASVAASAKATARTDAIPAAGSSIVSATTPQSESAAEIWDYVLPNGKTAGQNLAEINAVLTGDIEGGIDFAGAMRVLLAVAAGKTTIVSVAPGTATVEFRAVDDSETRVQADMVGSERVSVTINP